MLKIYSLLNEYAEYLVIRYIESMQTNYNKL